MRPNDVAVEASPDAQDGISLERRGRVSIIWLDRPDRGNGFTSAMQIELHRRLAEQDADEDVSAIVVTGRGRFFSTGADLEPGGSNFSFDEDQHRAARRTMRDRPRPWQMRTPIIGALNGSAVGIGLTFPLQWDIRIVNAEAKYGFVFTRRGLCPEQNSLWLLPKLIGLAASTELLLTGRLFSGTEAAALGIATEAVPADDVLPRALELAAMIANETSPAAVAATKMQIYEFLSETDRESAFHSEWETFRWLGRQADSAEGVAAFLERRPPAFTAPKTGAQLRKSSGWGEDDDA